MDGGHGAGCVLLFLTIVSRVRSSSGSGRSGGGGGGRYGQTKRLGLGSGHDNAAHLPTKGALLDVLLLAHAILIAVVCDIERGSFLGGGDDSDPLRLVEHGAGRAILRVDPQDPGADLVLDLGHLRRHVVEQSSAVPRQHGVAKRRRQQSVGGLHLRVVSRMVARAGQQPLGDDKGEGEGVCATGLEDPRLGVFRFVDGLGELQEDVKRRAAADGRACDARAFDDRSRGACSQYVSFSLWMGIKAGWHTPRNRMESWSKRVSDSQVKTASPSMVSRVV